MPRGGSTAWCAIPVPATGSWRVLRSAPHALALHKARPRQRGLGSTRPASPSRSASEVRSNATPDSRWSSMAPVSRARRSAAKAGGTPRTWMLLTMFRWRSVLPIFGSCTGYAESPSPVPRPGRSPSRITATRAPTSWPISSSSHTRANFAHTGVPTVQPRASQAAMYRARSSGPAPMHATADSPSARMGCTSTPHRARPEGGPRTRRRADDRDRGEAGIRDRPSPESEAGGSRALSPNRQAAPCSPRRAPPPNRSEIAARRSSGIVSPHGPRRAALGCAGLLMPRCPPASNGARRSQSRSGLRNVFLAGRRP